MIDDCLAACGLRPSLADVQHDDKWDAPIVESMQIAYQFAGQKTQTPTIVVESDPPYGFKGPVMSQAPTGEAAVRFWDAIQVISEQQGFFELTTANCSTDAVGPLPTCPTAPMAAAWSLTAGVRRHPGKASLVLWVTLEWRHGWALDRRFPGHTGACNDGGRG